MYWVCALHKRLPLSIRAEVFGYAQSTVTVVAGKQGQCNGNGTSVFKWTNTKHTRPTQITIKVKIELQTISWKTDWAKMVSKISKSPGGLNAHLNWCKLPLVHIGVCYQLEKLWRPSLGYFLHRAPSQPATPRRGHWGHHGNCHEQSLFFT